MLSRTAVLALALLGTLVLPSCSAYGPEYRELMIKGYEGDQVWGAIQRYASDRGMRPDPDECDVGRRTFQTRWQDDSKAFSRDGRWRLWAQVLEASDRENWDWVVRYYCEVQTVKDTSRNMSPREDDWSYFGQSGSRENTFRSVLNMQFARERKPKLDTSDPRAFRRE